MPGSSCRKGGKDVSKSVMHSRSCCRFSYQILIQLSPSSSADRSFSGPTFFDVENWVLLPENNKDFFCNLLVCSAMIASRGRSPLVCKRNIIYIVSSREWQKLKLAHKAQLVFTLGKVVPNKNQQVRFSAPITACVASVTFHDINKYWFL